MMSRTSILAAALILSGGGAARADHVMLAGGFAVGGGAGHSGPFVLGGFLDAHGWVSEHVGGFATAIGFGIPDYATHGSFLGGGVSLHWQWVRPVQTSTLELSVGVGRHHITGFTIFNTDPLGGGFDETNLGWVARIGGTSGFTSVLMAAGVAAYGAPGQGFAVVIETGCGFSL